MRRLYQRGATSNIRKIVRKTHCADIASALESFSAEERGEVFRLCPDDEKRAEVLSHLHPQIQEELLVAYEPSEIGNMIEHLDSDDAADLFKKHFRRFS